LTTNEKLKDTFEDVVGNPFYESFVTNLLKIFCKKNTSSWIDFTKLGTSELCIIQESWSEKAMAKIGDDFTEDNVVVPKSSFKMENSLQRYKEVAI
jgi:hypothetical protein